MSASIRDTAPAFQLDQVFKAFGAQRVLAGADLVVPRGSICAVVGRSGSGKTVLLKLLLRLLRPDAGHVRVEGLDLATLDEHGLRTLREGMGVLFQGDALFDSVDVFDNVAFPLREVAHLKSAAVEPLVLRALERVGLKGAEHELPGSLSGGMRKRVAFARATVREPRLLLLDDPTAGLDPLNTVQVAAAIRTASHSLDASVLMVTHDIATAFGVADEIALLDEGRIERHGPPAQMLASNDPRLNQFFHAYRDRLREAGTSTEELR